MTREEAKRDERDFSYSCVFEHQIKHPHLKDDLYVVEMTSGKKAIYERKLADKVLYNGTGQHDFDFKFIRYVYDCELKHEVRHGPCSGEPYDYYELLEEEE